MSVWLVTSDHIDLLVTAAVAWDLTSVEEAADVGRMVWAENLACVAYLYPTDRDDSSRRPGGLLDGAVTRYVYRPYPGRVDPEMVQTAARSLTCLSCEHPDWASSTARAWIERLATEAARRIPAFLANYGPLDPALATLDDPGRYVQVDLDGSRRSSPSMPGESPTATCSPAPPPFARPHQPHGLTDQRAVPGARCQQPHV